MKKIIIFSDGASKGNPGDAGIGVVLSDENGSMLCEIADYIGQTTNNVAEYKALIRGLEKAAELGASVVEISTDSQLLARQLAGVYKVKAPNLKPLHDQAMILLRHFAKVSISHVMREYNKRADQLANEGVRKHKNEKLNGSMTSEPAVKSPKQGELEF